MSIWHQEISPKINHRIISQDRRVCAVVRCQDHSEGLHTIHFMRYVGNGVPLMPKREPDKWVELWPRKELSQATLENAKQIARSLMAQIASTQSDHNFETKPFQTPPSLKWLLEIEHPSQKFKAIIGKCADGHHEVRYFIHQCLGIWSNDQTEEWDWMRTRWATATYTNDLAEAEEIAHIELEDLASVEKYPSVQQ